MVPVAGVAERPGTRTSGVTGVSTTAERKISLCGVESRFGAGEQASSRPSSSENFRMRLCGDLFLMRTVLRKLRFFDTYYTAALIYGIKCVPYNDEPAPRRITLVCCEFNV